MFLALMVPLSASLAQGEGEPFTRVWWERDTNQTSEEWTWSYLNWIFGPLPDYDVYFPNGTVVTRGKYIPLEWNMTLKISIPKSVFSGKDLGQVDISMYAWINENVSAYASLGYRKYDDSFFCYTHVYNQSEEYGYEGGYKFNEPTGSFMYIVNETSGVYEDDMWVNVSIGFRLDEERTVPGIYDANLNIMDNESNYISLGGYYYWYSGISLYKRYSIGGTFREFEYWYGSFYTMNRYLPDGSEFDFLSKGQEFIMEYRISGEPESITLSFPLPSSGLREVNVTGRYTTLVKHKGGWVYNSTEDSYRWDPEVEFVVQEQVYGTHTKRKGVEMNNYVEVEAAWYDQSTGELHYYNTTVEKKAYYVYDFASGTFATYVGYEYWNYSLELDRDVRVSVLEPWDGEEPLVYVLEDVNVSVDEGAYVVKFIGRVTEHTTDGASYMFTTTIFDKEGFEIYPKFYNFDENTILIQEFVAKASFIGSSGKVYDRWMFNVKNGDWFILNISMLGNS
ncbi:MAG: hypothetical protein ACTSWV_02130, partial [Candidatus Asgardarchaeia archaeon]